MANLGNTVLQEWRRMPLHWDLRHNPYLRRGMLALALLVILPWAGTIARVGLTWLVYTTSECVALRASTDGQTLTVRYDDDGGLNDITLTVTTPQGQSYLFSLNHLEGRTPTTLDLTEFVSRENAGQHFNPAHDTARYLQVRSLYEDPTYSWTLRTRIRTTLQ